MEKKLSREDLGKVAAIAMRVKIGLTSYLSDRQFFEVFGTDSI